MERRLVYRAIDSERNYQDSRWNDSTTSSKGKHSVAEWFVYIQDYLTEGMHLVSRNGDPEAIEMGTNIVRKIGAMCVACMEQNEVKQREGFEIDGANNDDDYYESLAKTQEQESTNEC